MKDALNRLVKIISGYDKDKVQLSINILLNSSKVKELSEDTLSYHQEVIKDSWVLLTQLINLVSSYLPIIIKDKEKLEEELEDINNQYVELEGENEFLEAELEKLNEKNRCLEEKSEKSQEKSCLDTIKEHCDILTDGNYNEYILLSDLDYIDLLLGLLPELKRKNQKLYYKLIMELMEVPPPFNGLEELLIPGNRLDIEDIPNNFYIDYQISCRRW